MARRSLLVRCALGVLALLVLVIVVMGATIGATETMCRGSTVGGVPTADAG